MSKADLVFDSLKLGRLGLGRRAYDYAMLGYDVLKNKHKLGDDKILSIADMSLPSGRKKFFVIDVKNYKLLFVTYYIGYIGYIEYVCKYWKRFK